MTAATLEPPNEGHRFIRSTIRPRCTALAGPPSPSVRPPSRSESRSARIATRSTPAPRTSSTPPARSSGSSDGWSVARQPLTMRRAKPAGRFARLVPHLVFLIPEQLIAAGPFVIQSVARRHAPRYPDARLLLRRAGPHRGGHDARPLDGRHERAHGRRRRSAPPPSRCPARLSGGRWLEGPVRPRRPGPVRDARARHPDAHALRGAGRRGRGHPDRARAPWPSP